MRDSYKLVCRYLENSIFAHKPVLAICQKPIRNSVLRQYYIVMSQLKDNHRYPDFY